MTAPVRIDAAAWGDLRFATLARLCGFADLEHGLIKCARIWSWQTEHYTEERPTHVVDVDTIESVLGPNGAAHLVRAKLAEETPDGFRIRGSLGRIEWLLKKREASKLGGEATKRKHENKDGPHGQPLGLTDGQPDGKPEPGPNQGPLTPALPPDQISENTHSRVRVAPPRHPAARRIADRVWNYGAKQSGELVTANVKVPGWGLTHGDEHIGWVALLGRVCERLVDSTEEHAERVCMNRIDVAVAKARKDGDGNWFQPQTLFSRNSFDTFAELDPKGFERKPAQKPGLKARAGAIGAATPRTDHGVESRPAREVL